MSAGPLGQRSRALLTLVCAVSAAMTMGVQAVLPAMPVLQDVFGISDAAAGWFTLAYTLPGLVLIMPLTRIAARRSRRWTLAWLLVAYAVFGFLQGLVGSYAELLVLRVLQGAVFAVAMPLTVVIIGESFAAVQQIHVLARRATWVTAGELALPITGGVLATISWQAPFIAQAAVLPLALVALLVLDDRRSGVHGDGVRSHIVAIIRGQQHGRTILMIGFARFVFKFSLIMYLPVLLVARGDATVAEAGVIVAVAAGTAGLAAAAVPWATRRIHPSTLLMLAASAVAAALGLFVLTSNPYLAAAPAVAFGVGDGIFVVLAESYVLRTWEVDLRPRVTAASQASRNLGKVVAPLVMSAIVAAASIEVGFAVMACLALLLVPSFARLRALDERVAIGTREAVNVI